MNRYLKIALAIAFSSIAISGGILILLFFPDFINKDVDSVTTITSISSAISAIFGLIIGTLAILALINAEKSESKTIEQFKIDLSSIASTLTTLRNRSFLFTNTDIIDYDLDVFSEERKTLINFSNSPSGFALYIWSGRQQNIEEFHSSIDFCSLIDFLSLKLKDNPQAILNQIAIRSSQLLEKITQITDRDFKDITRYLSKLGEGLNYARHQKIMDNDIFSSFAKEFEQDLRSDAAEDLELPSDEEIEAILNLAEEKIGGQSRETILHFLNEARNGGDKELLQFYKLIEKLDLNEHSHS